MQESLRVEVKDALSGIIDDQASVGELAREFFALADGLNGEVSGENHGETESEPNGKTLGETAEGESTELIPQETVVAFCGNSGEGAQIAAKLMQVAAITDNVHIVGIPSYPSSKKSPAGSPAGVSQRLDSYGNRLDFPEVADQAVAFSPVALFHLLKNDKLKEGSTVIIDSSSFDDPGQYTETARSLAMSWWQSQPVEKTRDVAFDDLGIQEKRKIINLYIKEFCNYKHLLGICKKRKITVIRRDLKSETLAALNVGDEVENPSDRSKNIYAAGLVIGKNQLSISGALQLLKKEFSGKKEKHYKPNALALVAGYTAGVVGAAGENISIEKIEDMTAEKVIASGAEAAVKAMIVLSYLLDKKIVNPGYPITPASNIMHILAMLEGVAGIETISSKDEISAVAGMLGAVFAGELGVTGTSGPGFHLMKEMMDAMVAMEMTGLFLLVPRGGRGTGSPTYPEQDLYTDTYFQGSIVVTVKDIQGCFDDVIDAYLLGLKHNQPVVVIMDAPIANGTGTLEITNIDEIKVRLEKKVAEALELESKKRAGNEGHDTVISSLVTNNKGEVAFGLHGERNKRLANKTADAAHEVKDAEISGQIANPDVVLISSGMNYGATEQFIRNHPDLAVAHVCLTFISPLPANTRKYLLDQEKNGATLITVETNLQRTEKVDDDYVPTGQLAACLRSTLAINIESLVNVDAQPVSLKRIEEIILPMSVGDEEEVASVEVDVFQTDEEPEPTRLAEALKQQLRDIADMDPDVELEEPGESLEELEISVSDQEHDLMTTKQEVKWCPGCGDGVVRKNMIKLMERLIGEGVKTSDIAIVSGIGCSGRITFYFGNGFRLHVAHGRVASVILGLHVANPDLKIFGVGGDGDMYSIGISGIIELAGNNPDVVIQVIDNNTKSLTGGHSGPGQEEGGVAKDEPYGKPAPNQNSLDILLAAGATFVSRSMSADARHHAITQELAYEHNGASFIEVLTSCPTLRKGELKRKVGTRGARNGFPDRRDSVLMMKPGEPLIWGSSQKYGLFRDEDGGYIVRKIGKTGGNVSEALVHDPSDKQQAHFLLSLGTDKLEADLHLVNGRKTKRKVQLPVSMGVFYQDEERDNYQDARRKVTEEAVSYYEHPDDVDKLSTSDEEFINWILANSLFDLVKK